MADFEEKNQEELKKDQSRTEFVRERVLNRSENRRRWIYRIAALVAGGLIFGVAACLAFAFLRHYGEDWFGKDQPPETQISLPRDEETEESTEETREPPPRGAPRAL